VADCIRVGEFFASPGSGSELSRQGKTCLRMNPGRWHKVTCQDELSKRRAKNAASCASAGSPIDFFSVAGSVTVPQD